MSYGYTPSLILACAFPPRDGMNGTCTSIEDVARHGVGAADQLFVKTRRDAVRLIVESRMDSAVSYGHGNRARRRQTLLSRHGA